MLRKLFRFFLIQLQFVMILMMIAAAGFLWRLHRGPINIDKLVPYIVQIATSSDTGTDISIESASLRWGGLRHLVDFHIRNFKAFDEEKHLIASIPQMSFSFSLGALLHGTIAPKTLVIYRPSLDLMINKTGEVKQNIGENEPTMALDALFETLKREKHLAELSLIKAKIKITDVPHDAVWNIPEASLTYSRRFFNNKLSGSIKIDLNDELYQSIKLNGEWKRKSKKIPLTITTENLNLSLLLPEKKFPFFKNLTTPVNLKIETLLDSLPLNNASISYLRKAVNQVKFSISGGKGIINLPDPVIARYNPQRFDIEGAMHASADGFDLTRIDIQMQNGASAQGDMSVSGIGDAIDTGNWKTVLATINAKAKNVPVADLASYWPASLGPDVHAWVKQNIRGGMIDGADFVLKFKGASDEAGIYADMVDGTIDVTGTQVVYLDGMPSVDNVSGHIHLTHKDLVVTIEKAVSDNVTAESGGTFSILGMTDPETTAVLDINASGTVPDILGILNSPALGFMTAIGIDPAKTTGTAQGNVQLKFPLGDALKSADQIYVKVDADVRNADVDDIILGMGIQDAILKVKMDGPDLSLNGTALFYGAAAKYSLTQSFDKKQKTMTDINLHVDLNDKARNHLDYPFSTAPAVSGVMPTDLSLIFKRNNKGVLNITSDLTNTEIDLREIGWAKKEKVPGKARFTLNLVNGKPTTAPVISLTDEAGTDIKGSLIFNKRGRLQQVIASSIKTPRTNANVTVDFPEAKTVNITLNGKEVDISSLLMKGTSFNKHSAAVSDNQNETEPYLVALKASIDKLWLSEKGYSENNTLVLQYCDGWEKLNLNSFVGEKKVPLILSLKPTATDDLYTFSLTSQDAGYTLKALEYTSSVKGGKLETSGIYTMGSGLKGTSVISDFYLEDDKVLIQILKLTSFTGIIDTLMGEGLFFDKAEFPFTMDKESITIDSALISGSSLGITLNGKYYLETNFMNIYGSIIPFYTLNSFLGKIPLIGGLFAGEKGGGLIAPTYTVKGTLPSPDISVNGFSALAPGAIRSVLGKITREEGDLSHKETVKKPLPVKKKEVFKAVDPASLTEIKDEELQHETQTERELPP